MLVSNWKETTTINNNDDNNYDENDDDDDGDGDGAPLINNDKNAQEKCVIYAKELQLKKPGGRNWVIFQFPFTFSVVNQFTFLSERKKKNRKRKI